ncbi:uncharacterized protein ddb_g0273453/ddb_g0273565 [Phtheirospermum japonicum]|uniref:Uncharacterized protein ddb_g0273453/ddb_g0273565 n=1 Tax=Phtheirospermum japonicum TaxID=374723 RepID=A0A830BBN3_9LAMI|nr:uncharacterized protein ddb_g0273453/ddb_g0273565 [Phtheirospermum japonicum]
MLAAEGVAKLLYIVVVEDDALALAEADAGNKGSPSFRYTRSVLQSTMQLMGCKARHAFKISQRVFEMMRRKYFTDKSASECIEVSPQDAKVYPQRETKYYFHPCLDKEDVDHSSEAEDRSENKPFELYKRRTTMVVGRKLFLDVVCEALSEYKYVGPNQSADLVLACRIRERKESVTVLLCGTSGCGKSTLSALLGSRLGITTVISTDSIRHMMRSFADEKQNPLLWASTYHAGEHLDPVAVAEAKAKKKAKKSAGVSAASLAKDEGFSNTTTGKSEGNTTTGDLISSKRMAVEGFKAQSEMVIDSLDRLITAWEERKESVVVEGVHLSLNFVEYRNQCTANSLSSKGMFQLIQRQGSGRHLMALLNNDGSVAKAWPVDIVDDNGRPIVGHPTGNGIGIPMYGPLQIGKAEPVNLQFGHFGISAWPGDTGGTSHASSFDESKGELTDNGGRYYSSCCSSPRISDGPSKEHKEEQSVHGSDEEVDEPLEVDSDEDLSDGQKRLQEEVEGSVDEESTKSDEEYDDLAMQDIPDSGYMCDDDEGLNHKMKSNEVLSFSRDQPNKNEHQANLDLFQRTKSEPLSESLVCAFAPPLKDKNERRLPPSSGNYRVRRRAQSIHHL